MLQIFTVQWVKIICWLSRAMFLPAVSYSFKLRSHKFLLYFRLHHQRFLEVFWPNNTALFDSTYKYENKDHITHINGSIRAEVPLQTRHTGNLVYGYKARQHCISFWNFNHLRWWAMIAYSVYRLAMGWMVQGLNPGGGGGGQIFCTCADWHWGPSSLLCYGYWVFPSVKQLWCGIDHPPHLVPKLIKVYSYTSTPPLCLHGLF